MDRKHKIMWTRIWKLVNVALMSLLFQIAWLVFYAPELSEYPEVAESLAVLVLFAALYILLARVYDAFLISQSRISELIGGQILAVMFTDFLLYVVIGLVLHQAPNVLPMLGALLVQSLVAVVWTYIAHQWYFRTFPTEPTIVIYDDEQTARAFVQEYGLRKRFHLVRAIHVSEVDASFSCLEGIHVVFLADVPGQTRDLIMKYCVEQSIAVYIIPSLGDIILSGARKVHMFHYPVLRVARYHPRLEYVITKRLFDLVVSLIALIVLSPLMLATAIAVFAYDRGPVLYRQTRLTKDGKTFTLLKFRSMHVNAESDGVARLSSGDQDPRITPVGRFLRKCRMDELPQLLNILKGDLSIVGPRPERPEIAAQYEESLPEFRLRLQAKAGLTGYAQVYGKYNTDPYHKLQLDLMYIANPSFLEDVRICFATVKVLFQSESTEGVQEGMTTAMETEETVAASRGG